MTKFLTLIRTRLTLLPDPHPVLGGDVEPVAGLYSPGLVPGVDVAQGGDGSDLAGRMGIADQLLAERLGPLHRPPHLSPAEEEALVAGEAADHRRRLSAQ